MMNCERKSNVRLGTKLLAVAHRPGQRIQNFIIEFVEGRLNRANAVAVIIQRATIGQPTAGASRS